jgi:hypothetical protein
MAVEIAWDYNLLIHLIVVGRQRAIILSQQRLANAPLTRMLDFACPVRLHLGSLVCFALSDGSWPGTGAVEIEWELAMEEGSIISERRFGAALAL